MSIIYQLKIELTGSHPAIWRRLTVRGNTPFDHLHDIIQIAMGWNNEYPFEFTVNETKIRDFGPELDLGDNPYDRDAMDCVLDELVTMVHTRFTYSYGHHDRREHEIKLEKILHHEQESVPPVCIGGEGDSPVDGGGGISHPQKTLTVLADKKHRENSSIKRKLKGPEGVVPFNIDEINANLRRYSEEWEEIYDEATKTIDTLEDENYEGDSDDPANWDSEYESLRHLRSPLHLLTDAFEKPAMEEWINNALAKKHSAEYKTFTRLVKKGHDKDKSREMILRALSIEWFYDLKYGTSHLEDRYERNLDRLPEEPGEILSLDCAIQILNKCTKGIPFAAIQYLHDDTSREATSAVVRELKNFSDHQYCWQDCVATPILYSFAAEGHLCEELIDPVIGFYGKGNINASDWLHDQGQYLIGKLAQKYPDVTVQKVLAAMEKDAEEGSGNAVYYLFDAFHFCNIDKYKDRLIALLKHDDIHWHDVLASTVAHLQIKEALPVLKDQLELMKAEKSVNWNMIEIEEAIKQIETGEDLYPDVDTPICLKRNTTWREEYAGAEEHFYDSGSFQEDNFDLEMEDDLDPELPWGLNYQQPIIKEHKTGRNDPCPCGSGKKYKKCCLDKDIHDNRN